MGSVGVSTCFHWEKHVETAPVVIVDNGAELGGTRGPGRGGEGWCGVGTRRQGCWRRVFWREKCVKPTPDVVDDAGVGLGGTREVGRGGVVLGLGGGTLVMRLAGWGRVFSEKNA